MAYFPALEDVPQEEKTSNYMPSLEDIPQELQNNNLKQGMDQLPFSQKTVLQNILKYVPSFQKPYGQQLKERAQGAKRGVEDIGEGLKQLYLEETNPDAAIKYTKQKDLERKQYEESAAGKDPMAQLFRSGVRSSPYFAVGGGILGSAESLIARMLGGGLTGAGLGEMQYVPGGEDRLTNSLEQGIFGAALPVVAKLPSILAKPFEIGSKALRNLTPFEEAAAKAKQQYQEAQNAEELAKLAAQSETGKGGLGALQYAQQQKQQQLAELPETTPSNLPVLSTEQTAKNLQEAQVKRDISENTIKDQEKNISDLLHHGADHDVQAAARILETQENVRKGLSNGYDKLKNIFSNNNVVIDNNPEIKKLNSQLLEFVKNNELQSKEAKDLVEQLNRLEKDRTIIPADQYLTTLRTAKDYEREARTNAFKPGMKSDEREEWKRTYKNLENIIENMEKNLENGVGKEYYGNLKSLNNAWRTNVIPLQNNTTYQTIRKRGRIEGDIMNKLRGTDPGDIIIRNIIQSNPEIGRYVVGQRYAAKPDELHGISERESPYVNNIPGLQDLISRHHLATSNFENSENALNIAKTQHKNALKAEKIAQEKAETEAKNISEIQKKKKMLDSQLEKIDKHIAILKEKRKQKNISLSEKIRTENELKKFEKEKKLNRYLAGLGAALVGVPYATIKGAKFISRSSEGEK